MRKITLLSLSLLVAASAAAGNITGKAAERLKRMNNVAGPRIAVMGHGLRTTKAFQLEKAGLQATPSMSPRYRAGAADGMATEGATAEMKSPMYGYLYGPDGSTWYYTQNTTTVNFLNTSSEIVIYDNNHNEAGHINITVPEDKKVNVIEPYGQITTKMFDRNDKTLEVTVAMHYLGENYNNTDSTIIYNMEGEKVLGYEGSIYEVTNIQQNAWTTYQRAILLRQEGNLQSDPKTYFHYDILKPAGWNGTKPELEHTFTLDFDLVNYSNGSCFSVYEVEGEPYYVLTYYKEPYVDGYDLETFEMIVHENNEYIFDVYDKNFERVDSFGVKIDKPDDALYRFAQFSTFSYNDMSKNYFTSDGGFNYVVTFIDYITSSDDDRYSFDVYDNKGNKLKNICDNVYNTWFQLSDIRGHEAQWAFMQTVGNNQQMRMVDLPSCNEAVVIPAEINGETISTTLDRWPKGDSYQYAISMNYADSDDAGNVISRIGWYNKDLTLDRFVKFSLGPNGQYFTPLLYNESLDPYLFDTDDEHEYVYLAKIKRTNSNVLDNVITIANEDGSVVREFRGDDSNAIYTGGIENYGKTNAEFFVTYQNASSGIYTVDYMQLPFSRFTAGGDGTKDNPYLVATLGDLQQIKCAPSACYKLTADIDMNGYPAQWTPIEMFNGVLDGDGHSLRNFSIASTSYNSGLFGTLGDKSKIRNLVVLNPELNIGDECSYAGIIGGTAITDSISNVHVYGARIDGNKYATVGGLVGQASLYSEISASSFDGTIDTPAAECAGGIVADTRTGSTVKGCLVTGSLTAATSLGGIVGITGTDATVSDCRADVTLKAENTVGGIVGKNSSRAAVSRCRADGTIEVTSPSLWDGSAAGGIIGYLESDWASSKNIIVSGCVSGASISIPEGSKNDGTANRIVGRTIANEDYEPNETPLTELGLAKNYALSTVTIDGESVTSDDDTSVNGASLAKADATKEFFTTLEYAYGTGIENPWKGAGLPSLWFEDVAVAIELSHSSVALKTGETAEITATVFGTDASAIEFVSSDPSVAVVEVIAEDGNTATIRIECKKDGTATITAKAGDVTAECEINPVSTAITAATETAGRMEIRLAEGRIEAAGASRMSLYNAAGQLVARAAGSSVSTAGMAKGIYVVLAADAEGRTKSSKVVVK